jgi:hypothetical protein
LLAGERGKLSEGWRVAQAERRQSLARVQELIQKNPGAVNLGSGAELEIRGFDR